MRLAAKILLPVVVLAMAMVGFGWLRATRPEATPRPPEERSWSVAGQPAAFTSVQPEIAVFGEVVAARAATLRPLVAGRITEVGAGMVEGGVVRRGDLLVEIDRLDYETGLAEARAALAEAEASLLETQADLDAEQAMVAQTERMLAIRVRDLERRRALAGSGTTSERAVDESELAVASERQALARSRSAIDRYRARVTRLEAAVDRAAAVLRRAERDLEETRFSAPFDGVLSQVDASIGKRVGVGDPIARITDLATLEARFQLDNRDFARLLQADALIGRPVTVHWRVGGERFDFPAVIDRVGAQIDAASGGVDLFARLVDGGSDLPLRPGAFVEVTLDDLRYEQVLRLPIDAVHDGGIVYTVGEDERLAEHPVEVVRRVGSEVLVRGTLPDGAEIAVTDFPEIGPGVRVRLR